MGFFEFFYNFDYTLLNFWHSVAISTGGVFYYLSVAFAYLGKAGIFSLCLGAFLLIFKKTRKTGFAIILSVGIGALVTNAIVKPLVARPRPYTVEPFRDWWLEVGGMLESDASFPSGHTTVAFDTVMAIFLTSKKKKVTWLYFLIAIFMAISRNVLCVHYPSDVLFGAIIGSLAGVGGYFLTLFGYKVFDKFMAKRKAKIKPVLDSEKTDGVETLSQDANLTEEEKVQEFISQDLGNDKSE